MQSRNKRPSVWLTVGWGGLGFCGLGRGWGGGRVRWDGLWCGLVAVVAGLVGWGGVCVCVAEWVGVWVGYGV